MGERCDVDLLPMLEERKAEYDSMVLARPDKKPKEIVVKEKQTERLINTRSTSDCERA